MSDARDLLAAYPATAIERLRALRLVVVDVDGVLTDGRITLGDDGTEYKAFHTHDGHGLRMLQDNGVGVGIITGRSSAIVHRRAHELGIAHLMQGRRDKAAALDEMAAESGQPREAMAYVGDDVVDLAAMNAAGSGVAVANAPASVRAAAEVVLTRRGGDAAVRELCELVMAAQGTLASAMDGPGG
jgi:3-deoxy-D-manno-octulosonate 8-phosphate phosphatase (KDO 8-P phosphatase)